MTPADAGVILSPQGPSCNQLSWEQNVLGARSRKEDSLLREADPGRMG